MAFDDIDAKIKTMNRLKEAAEKGESVTFKSHEAKWIHEHIRWLGDERESLLSSGAFDDD